MTQMNGVTKMKAKPYLVFMDIDGTLAVKHQKVSDYTINTIKTLQKRDDVIFYIASGRMYEFACLVRNQINTQVHMITSNGAYFETADRTVSETLGTDALTQVYDVSRKYNLPVNFFAHDTVYYTKKVPSFVLQNFANIVSGNNKVRSYKAGSPDTLLDHATEINNGIMIAPGHSDLLKEAHKELAADQLLELSSSGKDNIELIPKGVDKATAVQAVQESFGTDAAHTLVFGDGMNDTGMMHAADISVAMGNALPQVKAIANYETDTNTNDGLAKFLRDYFEMEK